MAGCLSEVIMEPAVDVVFILSACLATLVCMGLTLYTVVSIDRAAAERQRAVLEAIQRGAAERAGVAVTLEEQIAAAREAADDAREQAGVARIYAMEAQDAADEMRDTDPGPAPSSGPRGVLVALRPVQ